MYVDRILKVALCIAPSVNIIFIYITRKNFYAVKNHLFLHEVSLTVNIVFIGGIGRQNT